MLKPRSGAPRSQSFAICSSRAHDLVVERADLRDFRAVPRLSQPRDRLSDLSDRASFEAEALRIDDRLVAHVQRAKSGLLEQGARLAADAQRCKLERPLSGKSHDHGQQRLHRLLLADRIPGDHQDAALDPVTDECRPLLVEQVLLVGSELEERQGVGTVFANELRGCAPRVRVRKVSGRSQRAEHDVCRRKESEEAGQLDGQPC